MMKLYFTDKERKQLRKCKIKQSTIHLYTSAELAELIACDQIRAKELIAQAQFQQIPSIGPRFASSLIGLGYYSLDDLRDRDGAKLTDSHEKQCGYPVDPCVEDQFRLVVYYANHPEATKNWWDFTAERKRYRQKYGYPADRPELKRVNQLKEEIK
ncbi:hypothetical protein JOC54_002929 [Alkalihalobacillus xiaoxiensis]|uniref:Pathogenicity locus n=1 Tax=Shouchella xiaoxiensis TaxID=766895 RepID=A0ABS2SYY1_9BACI|nr:helix-hairpin-helix domain-containing protein [Shouchella xiaoxiensis]MBM7839649.1 hypothetical protein [Shouchella xiaoxiensis]